MVKTILSTLRYHHVVDDMTTALTLNLALPIATIYEVTNPNYYFSLNKPNWVTWITLVRLHLVTGQKTASEATTRPVWTPRFDVRQNRLTSEG